MEDSVQNFYKNNKLPIHFILRFKLIHKEIDAEKIWLFLKKIEKYRFFENIFDTLFQWLQEDFSIQESHTPFVFYPLKMKDEIKKEYKHESLYKFYLKVMKNELLIDSYINTNKYSVSMQDFLLLIEKDFSCNKTMMFHYIHNFEKFNMILSEKLFMYFFPKFNLHFFSSIYIDQLQKNSNTPLDIMNYYYHNQHLFQNKEEFYKKYVYIDLYFIYRLYHETFDEFEIIKNVLHNKIYSNTKEFIGTIGEIDLPILYSFNSSAKFNDNYDIYKFIKNNENCIYSIHSFLKNNKDFNLDFYRSCKDHSLDDHELIIQYHTNKNKDISIPIAKIMNEELVDIDEKNIHMMINATHIINIIQFKTYYMQQIEKHVCKDELILYKNKINDLNNEIDCIQFIKQDICSLYPNTVGRKNAFLIEEVLLDLKSNKPILQNGLSLLIRAKNEEENIIACIESVVDLVDEIIFVNNNSSDQTLSIIEKLSLQYNHIKVYNYFIDVPRAGKDHQEAVKSNNKNTLGTYYNWCLSKSTMKHVIKWDADFICIRNNFQQMIRDYKIKEKKNNYSLWFTGSTLFIHNDVHFLKLNSYYNEFRLFSNEYGFQWYDGEFCEYVEPFTQKCKDKIHVSYPLFFEMKRTKIDEFDSRSSLIDQRDKDDFELLSQMKKSEFGNNLFPFPSYLSKKILIVTPSLSAGGSNIFIRELYQFFKQFGCITHVYADAIDRSSQLFLTIDSFDMKTSIEENYDYYFLNGYIPNLFSWINKKLIFITHSDVAFSNSVIGKYHTSFYQILTVNEITKSKLIHFYKINPLKIKKIINYKKPLEIKVENKKNNIFGVITRFSSDKNIVMLLFALKTIFIQYPHYTCILVGYEDKETDIYLKYLTNYLQIETHVRFDGFKENTTLYYELFDFIILPSVSEGCSYNVLESMMYEKLIVLSDVGGNRELFPNNTCIFIEYDGIKEFEKKTMFITNYEAQLELLGYIIIELHEKKHYTYQQIFNNQRIIPSILVNSIKHNKKIEKQKNRWRENQLKIENAIIQAIQMDINKVQKYREQNKLFYDKHFNKYNYYSQLFEYLKTYK